MTEAPEITATLGPTVYDAAVAFLKDGGDPAKLPRTLGIGQIVAAEVFAHLEREGILSKPAKDGTRKVLP